MLVTALVASLFSPLLGPFAPWQFAHDFIAFAYILGLGRVLLMLSAMDTGSSFEGMGASREATFSALGEPALFVLVAALMTATGATSFAAVVGGLRNSASFAWMVAPVIACLFILLQTEASRVPVDDPLTHLELTMIHEVMILDHSGPELAAMQYAAALKMSIYAGLIAALVNPVLPTEAPALCASVCVAIMSATAVAVGCVESVVARLRMRWIPRYVLAASAAALLSLLLASGGGSAP